MLGYAMGASVVSASGHELASAAQRHNIILATCDGLGWGDVGFNGKRTIITPHLPGVAGLRYVEMDADYTRYERSYYGCITAMNEQMGRLRKTLHDLSVRPSTTL